ncbi:MAG: hypothetical protein V4760_15400 [Bdellovibrionota bacterium]
MAKFKFEVLTSAILALSFAFPAQAAELPTKKPASDGMAIKLVPARKYGGKMPKRTKEKSVRLKKTPPQSVTVRGSKLPMTITASAKKTVIPEQNMQKIAAPTRPVSKTIAVVQNPPPRRAKETQTLAQNDLPAEKDLVDTLDSLPVTSEKAPAPMLSTRIASPGKASAPMFTPILQLRSRVTTGRKYELEEIGGKNFSRKHEVFLGAKHSSGFGASLTGSVSVSSFDDDTKNKQTTNDITTILYHPTLYKADGWDFYGYGRVYFPTSDASKKTNSTHYLYVLGTNYDFGGGFRLENCIIPHYWTKDSFADDDTYFLLEEELIAKYDVNKTITLGLGPYAQIDSHERAAPGTSIEITPIVALNLGDHAYFESKMYLPVYTDGQVGGGPRRAALSEIAGEFYLKLWL